MSDERKLSVVEDVEEWLFRSRNADQWHGDESFADMIDIPGWEHQSLWGYDEMIGSFFAQLYPNDWTLDEPALWLSGVYRPVQNPHHLARRIHYEIHATPQEIVDGLGIATVSPIVRAADELEAKLDEVMASSADPFADGVAIALRWLTRRSAFAPGSCNYDLYRDDPRQADAERIVASGGLYAGDNSALSSGVDSALSWALGVLREH